MADFILPHALPGALDGRPGIKLLSLDCFDTLLWRDTHAPKDLFGALPATTVTQRQWAEARARTAADLREKRGEVTIEEIYRELLPNGSSDTHDQGVRNEIDAEAAHCFAFRPTVELMRTAKARGLEVIIVSDTYLDPAQLRGLIAAAAGEEVAGLIDRVFCSASYGMAKSQGLYEHVLKELAVAPHEILHIGDNKRADCGGVAPFGVHTLHLRQFIESTEQRLRLEASVGAMLHPLSAETALTHQPHRAALSLEEPVIGDAAEAFGFATLGPVLHGFDRWLADESAALAVKHGGKVHHVFLMRDGYLPQLMYQARSGEPGHALEISRFTATAASFLDDEAVRRYLELETETDPAVLARQFQLPKDEIETIIRQLPHADVETRFAAFAKAITTPSRLRRIVKTSTAFADRLVAHVRRTVDPQPGDTLMLVDLGYNGSVQNEIEALLVRSFGVHVAGRYLLLREQFRAGYDKQGFIGHDHYDGYTLEALCTNVAVLEQLCTAAQGSVVDYAADGASIRKGNSIKSRQSEVRERIQAGAIRFARTQADVTIRAASVNDAALWRRGAAAVMGRLMYMPLAEELAVLGQFEHDVNLGVDNTVALFDSEIARKGLRQRGLFYMKGADRMYLPAELQGEGLALKLSLLAHKRFGLSLKYVDFIDQTISLPLILADGRDVTTGNVTATPTHDGYYIAPIPVGDCRFSVGIQFGQLFDFVQVDSVMFMPVDRFLSDKVVADNREIEGLPSLEGMTQAAPHLFHCADEYSFMMVPPPPRQGDRQMMLAVVFRPIAKREAKPAPTAANLLLGANA
ncbi:FMN phosphatase YigB (HAD superfamily) [Sphingomonas naasensis]|uniref:HAD family hydrolase n=1 Tax=Sphingomonas naasensis TaxID=1344951 RepID=A0A4S1WJ91_9SPHN|nr:HAD family hydrolase [Sphingomonas naasensis]NIJ20783.1 FMN phosphatase YigB (HAD superfamily) [Sphingomonas naasensis]TGX43189.1 HAD family hydrolase [Sphingomonas naasensis]